jgi:flagellar biosynthesis/type III secretory pathway ATPase
MAAGEARADFLAIGAYQRGADPDADAWFARRDALEAFVRQRPDELSDFATTVRRLADLTR